MTLRDPRDWRPASDPPYTTKRVEVLLVGCSGKRHVQGYYDNKRAQWFSSFQARLKGRALNVEAWRPLQ